MAHYVVIGRWTEQGIKNVKGSVHRLQAFRKAVEAAGGKVHQFLYTMGPQDLVAILEAPSDEVVNLVILKTAMQGNVHTVTSKAWTEAEFAKLEERL